MEIYWNNEDGLEFKVHMKENQVLKYLNLGSCHTNNCFKAIPSRVFNRLTSLTSKTSTNLETKMNILYPNHAKALINAKLAPETSPTMNEVLKEVNDVKKKKKGLRKQKNASTQDKSIFTSELATHSKVLTQFM